MLVSDSATGVDEIPHTDDWQDHYPTTTFRGQQQYPVPEEWVLNEVEADGVMWKRYADIGADHHKDHEVVEERGYSMNAGTPDEEAIFGRGKSFEWRKDANGEPMMKSIADPPDHELTIGGVTVFTVHDPVATDRLWAATAAVLARHSRGEDYSEIAEVIDNTVDPTDPGENDTLDGWV